VAYHIAHRHPDLAVVVGEGDDIEIVPAGFVAVEAHSRRLQARRPETRLRQEILLHLPGDVDGLFHAQPLPQLPSHLVETTGQLADFIPGRDGQRGPKPASGQIVGGSGDLLDADGEPAGCHPDQEEDEQDTGGKGEEIEVPETNDRLQDCFPGGHDHHGPGRFGQMIEAADLLRRDAGTKCRAVVSPPHLSEGLLLQLADSAEGAHGEEVFQAGFEGGADQHVARVVDQIGLVALPPGGANDLLDQDIEGKTHLDPPHALVVAVPELIH